MSFLCFFLCFTLSVSVDWTLPQYYSTSRVVSAGNYVVHVTRGPDGLLISAFDVVIQKWVFAKEFAWMDDANGWGLPLFYETIQVVSLGQRAYIFARGTFGSTLVVFDVATFSLALLPLFPFLASQDGFTSPAHYRTIRAGVAGTSLYLTARDSAGVHLASFDTVTATWTQLPTLAQFLNEALWTQEKYYRTFQMVGLGSTLWFMIRGEFGLYLFSFSTVTLLWNYSGTPAYPVYDDAGGWDVACYYEVFQMVSFATGFCITTRSIGGLITNIYRAPTQAFQDTGYALYLDSGGWCGNQFHRTVKATACGDKLLFTGRGVSGLEVGRFDTVTSIWAQMQSRARFTDAEHWNDIYRYTGLLETCVDDWLYVAGRDTDYLKMERLSVSGNSWESVETITSLACHPTCQVCFSSALTDCTYCYFAAHLSDTSPSPCVCNSGYFPNPHAGSCAPCDPSCKECTGSAGQQCTACFPYASLSALFQPCSCMCDRSYFPNPNESHCTSCSPSCLDCTGERANQCIACKVYASLFEGSCICVPGYYMELHIGDCYQCDSTCESCSGPLAKNCVVCFFPAQLTSSNSCECVSQFFPSPDASRCLPCPYLCSLCPSTQACVRCLPNARLDNDLCKCMEGYYENPSLVLCERCSEGCNSCILTGCLSCASSLFLNQGRCTRDCPSGMVVSDNSCVDSPPEPRLSAFPNNTLELSFSKQLSRQVKDTDFVIEVWDGHWNYTPTWNVSVMTSYLIDLVFADSVTPTNYSRALLIFNDPTSLHDFQGQVISKSNLTANLNPFPPALSSSALPLDTNSAATQQATTTVQGAMTLALTSSLFTGSSTSLLNLFNQLQLITYIPLMNVELPAKFGNTLLGLSVNSFTFNPLSYLYDPTRASTPPSFALAYGYDSTLFLLNCSSFLIALSLVLVTFALCYLFSHMSSCYLLSQYFAHLVEKYHWGVPLRMWLQAYLDVGVCGLLQFSGYSWRNYGAKENGVLAGVSLCLFFFTPPLLTMLIVKHRKEIQSRVDPTVNMLWGVLYEEFRAAGVQGIAFYIYFVFTRCLYALALICFHSSPAFQQFSSLTTSLMVHFTQMLLYCGACCPYRDGFSQLSALLSEVSTFLLFILTACFRWTPAVSELGEKLGMVGVWVVYVSIAGNAVLSLVQTVYTWRELVRRFKRIATSLGGPKPTPSS